MGLPKMFLASPSGVIYANNHASRHTRPSLACPIRPRINPAPPCPSTSPPSCYVVRILLGYGRHLLATVPHRATAPTAGSITNVMRVKLHREQAFCQGAGPRARQQHGLDASETRRHPPDTRLLHRRTTGRSIQRPHCRTGHRPTLTASQKNRSPQSGGTCPRALDPGAGRG